MLCLQWKRIKLKDVEGQLLWFGFVCVIMSDLNVRSFFMFFGHRRHGLYVNGPGLHENHHVAVVRGPGQTAQGSRISATPVEAAEFVTSPPWRHRRLSKGWGCPLHDFNIFSPLLLMSSFLWLRSQLPRGGLGQMRLFILYDCPPCVRVRVHARVCFCLRCVVVKVQASLSLLLFC